MYSPVSPKADLVRMEEGVLSFWKRNSIFQRSAEQRQGSPEFVFYEGPPTANGRPGAHHVLARAFKDLFPRYKTMRGYHVLRRGGWDTHGLPVEIEVERQLGFTSKRQIEEFGIDRFNEMCRRSVFAYIQDWESLTDRIAFWVDMQDAYVTYTNDYIESVWWILKSFWERGLLYQGRKVVPYCPRCGTPLSDHEVAQGYAETEDPSVYVRLPLVDEPNTSLLVWTTTPWTLPGNVAVAAHPDEVYVTVEHRLHEGGSERLVLARALLDQVFAGEPVRVVETYKGKHLKGKRYQPLYTFLTVEKPAYRVILEEFVSMEGGTGLVHIAPAFGAEDLSAARKYDLPVLVTVAEDGTFVPEVRPWRGLFVKQADPLITEDLDGRGLLLKGGTYTHAYPFCWRCDTPLLYYARSTWYLKTTGFRDRLVEINRRVNWYPEHIKEGRFGKWLENNVDWALGRERYWGTPLPIWICRECDNATCVGSMAELSSLSGSDLRELDLHRPHIDQVTFPCPECGGKKARVPELVDVWFDSGAMPVAQWHYPMENADRFKSQFPADFVCEAVDQTRGWFYSLHAISTLLFDQESFRNIICLGLMLDADGQKMSKSRGNDVDPWDVINSHGADAFRWYLYSSNPPGQERRFSVDLVGEVVRGFTLPLWNVYSFFVTYARLDGWTPIVGQPDHRPAALGQGFQVLDRWLLSELNLLVRDVTRLLDQYDIYGATRLIQSFVDDLSKWYVRRSRRRFWRSEADADKHTAYTALYTTLVTLSKLLAPAMPYLAEELYRNMVVPVDHQAPESVHLTDWPEFSEADIDAGLNREMRLVMKLASLGHAARNAAGLKVRQPLSGAEFLVGNADEAHVVAEYAPLLKDELNVRQVRSIRTGEKVVSYRLNPLPKQLGQKYKNRYPAIRAALLALDPEAAAPVLLAGGSLQVDLHGERCEVLPEEVEVRAVPREGLAVAADGPYLAAISTDLSTDLVAEGLAREFVRHVQELRKQSGFDHADRIHLWYAGSGQVVDAIESHREYIMAETLAVELTAGPVPEQSALSDVELEGQSVAIAITKPPGESAAGRNQRDTAPPGEGAS